MGFFTPSLLYTWCKLVEIFREVGPNQVSTHTKDSMQLLHFSAVLRREFTSQIYPLKMTSYQKSDAFSRDVFARIFLGLSKYGPNQHPSLGVLKSGIFTPWVNLIKSLWAKSARYGLLNTQTHWMSNGLFKLAEFIPYGENNREHFSPSEMHHAKKWQFFTVFGHFCWHWQKMSTPTWKTLESQESQQVTGSGCVKFHSNQKKNDYIWRAQSLCVTMSYPIICASKFLDNWVYFRSKTDSI